MLAMQYAVASAPITRITGKCSRTPGSAADQQATAQVVEISAPMSDDAQLWTMNRSARQGFCANWLSLNRSFRPIRQ